VGKGHGFGICNLLPGPDPDFSQLRIKTSPPTHCEEKTIKFSNEGKHKPEYAKILFLAGIKFIPVAKLRTSLLAEAKLLR